MVGVVRIFHFGKDWRREGLDGSGWKEEDIPDGELGHFELPNFPAWLLTCPLSEAEFLVLGFIWVVHLCDWDWEKYPRLLCWSVCGWIGFWITL